jgi:hypothetical protein
MPPFHRDALGLNRFNTKCILPAMGLIFIFISKDRQSRPSAHLSEISLKNPLFHGSCNSL